MEGLDRLVSIYPSLEAAIAAGTPATDASVKARAGAQAGGEHVLGPGGTTAAAITPAVLWQLIDALDDGLVLTTGDGQIVLVNRRLADMFGYQRLELIGRPVEIPYPSGPPRSSGNSRLISRRRACQPGATATSALFRAAGELACRPGSVHPLARAGGHPSGTAIAGSLVRSTRELGRAALKRSRRKRAR